MTRSNRSLLLCLLIAGGIPAAAAGQERPTTAVPLARLIGAFLVDSGIRTTGLPWTTGGSMPIRWYSTTPVTNTDPAGRARGLTHTRTGAVRVTLGDSVTLPMHVLAIGPITGLAQVVFSFDSLLVETPNGGGFFVHREMVEIALKNEGMILQPIKCQRATEGASYGNLVDAARLPGKTASGLWWYWQTAQQELQLTLSLLYRRTDMGQVECYTP